jgi:hypothetical protein
LSSPADPERVLRGALRFTSFLCCALVLASFAVFTNDQLADASAHQQSEIASGATVTPSTTVAHGQPWRFVDDAASRLTAPFDSIVPTHNVWVSHGTTLLFALLVYGLGLGWVARFSSGRPVAAYQ